jgi:hypothetical protein
VWFGLFDESFSRLLRLFVLGEIFMVIGIIAGVGIMLYAQLKYNHGIF